MNKDIYIYSSEGDFLRHNVRYLGNVCRRFAVDWRGRVILKVVSVTSASWCRSFSTTMT